jgi:hypothetical protein
MTSPGGGEIIVSPGDIYDHIARRRNQAADFFTDKPPDIPGDPGGNDATKDATDDLNGAVQGTSHGLGHHSNNVADGMQRAANDYANTDGHNAAMIQTAGPIGPAGQAAKGLTDVGVGSIMNSFLSPTGTVTGAFEQMLSGLSQAGGGFGQAGANIVGQTSNASIGYASKIREIESHGAPGGESKGAPGGEPSVGGGGASAPVSPPAPPIVSETTPASGIMPPSAVPSATAGLGSDYVHTEAQDRNDTTVHPTGMAMGAMPAGGLGALGGRGSSGSGGSASTYQVTTGNDDHDPGAEPTPVLLDPGIAAAPVSVSLPLGEHA